ncbi:hypothetical protein [Noviherbaspirillum suwonense]|uniref:hypothetical protein n=1 Tax=Noviherbaspirillum suwonense TaxID=1224511 RepID=UPI0024B782FD|nr:hypothetical protein [Noviherbaspirillum suwonense]
MPMTPEEFGAYIRNDIAKWSQLAKTRILEIDNPPSGINLSHAIPPCGPARRRRKSVIGDRYLCLPVIKLKYRSITIRFR